jgi:orotate phosphoribosyltransferase
MDNSVISLLRQTGALLEGHFLLSSGRHSDKYFQCAKLLAHPDKAAAALEAVALRVREAVRAGEIPQADMVCGPAMGGIVVAYELGRQLGLPAIFTERDDAGQMTLRRGFEVPAGTRIIIAEDVVTTGKSSAEAARALEAAGAQVIGEACVVDRRAGAESLPWPLFAACKVEAQNWEATDCPLCKQGIAAVKPGSRKM